MQDVWLLAAVVVERLARATGDDADFIRDEITKLMGSRKILGRSAITRLIVPADHWHNGSLSKTGMATIPAAAIGPYYARHPIELRLADVLKCWPDQADILTAEAEPEPPARGPGRRSTKHIFIPLFYRRHAAGERHRSLAGWGRALEKDGKANKHTIRNHLSKEDLPDSIKKDL